MYGVIFKFQKELIEKHCMGDCGKILLGIVFDEQLGELAPCNHAECPHLDKQMSTPIGRLCDGEEIILRKLK